MKNKNEFKVFWRRVNFADCGLDLESRRQRLCPT